VEEVELPDALFRNLHLLLGGPDSSGDGPVRVCRAFVQPTPQPLGPQLVRLDALLEASDLGLDLLDCECVALVPEHDHLFLVPVGRLQRQALVVGEHWGGARDVGRSQSQEFGTIVTREEQAERALVPGLLEGRYGDAEGGRERVMELGEVPVELGVEGQEFGAGTGEERLEFPEGHFDVVEAGLGEDVELNVLGDGLRVLEGHLLGLDADRHHQGAEGPFLSFIGEAEWHDGGERQLSPLKVYVDAGEDVVPDGRDAMTVDGAQLAPEGSGVGALALGPGRAGLNDEASAAAQAVGIGVGVGIVLGEAGRVDLGFKLDGNLNIGLAKLEEGLGDVFDNQGRRCRFHGRTVTKIKLKISEGAVTLVYDKY